jgi:hypothetical protein
MPIHYKERATTVDPGLRSASASSSCSVKLRKRITVDPGCRSAFCFLLLFRKVEENTVDLGLRATKLEKAGP